MGVESYPDTYSKIALTLTSAQVAKESLVAEQGVGSDVPFNFFGWDDSTLSMIVQLDPDKMNLPMSERFDLCSGAMHAMRSYFGCTELTFVAEGLHSSKPELTEGKNLKELFDAGSPHIRECITVCHVSLTDLQDPEATFVSATYQYLTDFVLWDDERAYTRGVGQVLRNVPFPAMMAASLRAPFENPDEEEIFRIVELLLDKGFNVNQFT
jgi:hypothetical protein